MTTSTTPTSGYTRAQLTPAIIEDARAEARRRGDKQFGFRTAKGQPYHTLLCTEGGTLANPTGACSESPGSEHGYYR